MTENITRILVPVDFSPHAEHAFCYATTLAYQLGAQLALLHVVEDPFVTGAWSAEIYVPNSAGASAESDRRRRAATREAEGQRRRAGHRC
jgi:nucleotide-binding universal stress UspA family protein